MNIYVFKIECLDDKTHLFMCIEDDDYWNAYSKVSNAIENKKGEHIFVLEKIIPVHKLNHECTSTSRLHRIVP